MIHEVYKYSNTNVLKIALLLEPTSVCLGIYEAYDCLDQFDYIYTYDDRLLNHRRLGHKCIAYTHGDSWLPESVWTASHPKSKLCSMLASEKNGTIGHKIRHRVYNDQKDNKNIDFYGNICNRHIDDKTIALGDYYFSIIIENCCQDDYFSEKLLDCIATKTIPIYFGTRRLYKYFNDDGIISFNSIKELYDILSYIHPDNINNIVNHYNQLLPAIEENWVLAHKYRSIDCSIWDTLQELLSKVQRS
jgi:hypothetical protein